MGLLIIFLVLKHHTLLFIIHVSLFVSKKLNSRLCDTGSTFPLCFDGGEARSCGIYANYSKFSIMLKLKWGF
jgi:hypothetical protein